MDMIQYIPKCLHNKESTRKFLTYSVGHGRILNPSSLIALQIKKEKKKNFLRGAVLFFHKQASQKSELFHLHNLFCVHLTHVQASKHQKSTSENVLFRWYKNKTLINTDFDLVEKKVNTEKGTKYIQEISNPLYNWSKTQAFVYRVACRDIS